MPYGISKKAGGDTPAAERWMARCIASVEKNGTDKKLAIVLCKSQYQKLKGKGRT